jgi:hypothetical protein
VERSVLFVSLNTNKSQHEMSQSQTSKTLDFQKQMTNLAKSLSQAHRKLINKFSLITNITPKL